MLYKIAHFLRDKLNWLWNIIERLNGWLFSIRYGKILERITIREVPEGFCLVKITEEMVAFFNRQPEEAYTFFHPREFDAKSVRRLQKFVFTIQATGRIMTMICNLLTLRFLSI